MILRFEEDFPGAKVFKLEENYRSTQTILAAANELIVNNPNRAPKTLVHEARPEGEKITAFQAESERAEVRYVMEKIKEHVREGSAYRDFLVLYRTNAQSRYFEEGFLAEGIPYRVVGGVGFYARTEIKDMLSYLRYIVNPSDAVAFRRIVNVPRRSIGQQTLTSLLDAANAAGVSVGQAVFDSSLLKRAVPKKQRELERFAELINDLREKAKTFSISDLLVAVMEESGYLRELQGDDTNEGRARVENLTRTDRRRARVRGEPGNGNVARRLPGQHRAGLAISTRSIPSRRSSRLMTMHAAKGLEFPIVFLTGLEEGVFPHTRALTDTTELEEERRLAYVGVTRAMDRIYLSYRCASHALRQHVLASEVAVHRRDALDRGDRRSRHRTASGRRPLARSLDPRERRRRRRPRACGGRPRASSQVGRRPRRRHRRSRRRRAAHDQLPERRTEDGHAQVRSVRASISRCASAWPARSAGSGASRPRQSLRRTILHLVAAFDRDGAGERLADRIGCGGDARLYDALESFYAAGMDVVVDCTVYPVTVDVARVAIEHGRLARDRRRPAGPTTTSSALAADCERARRAPGCSSRTSRSGPC